MAKSHILRPRIASGHLSAGELGPLVLVRIGDLARRFPTIPTHWPEDRFRRSSPGVTASNAATQRNLGCSPY